MSSDLLVKDRQTLKAEVVWNVMAGLATSLVYRQYKQWHMEIIHGNTLCAYRMIKVLCVYIPLKQSMCH